MDLISKEVILIRAVSNSFKFYHALIEISLGLLYESILEMNEPKWT